MMTRNPRTNRLALMLAVSALALAGPVHAQSNQQQPQRQQSGQQQQAQGQQNQGGQQQTQRRQAQQQAQGQQNQQQAQGQRRGGQQQAQASKEYQQVRGTIRGIRRVNVRGSDRPAILVLLETQGGNRVVADLGTEQLGVQLQEGEQLAVRGRPVSIGNQRIVLQANAVRYAGQTLDVNRPAPRQSARRQTAQAQGGGAGRQTAQAQGGGGQGQRLQLGPYDANRDARFSARELTRALYDDFDRDGNGTLSIAEWDRGIDRMFGEGDVNLRVSQWDRNGNDRISRTEFRRGLERSGLLARVNSDYAMGGAAVGGAGIAGATAAAGMDGRGLDRSTFRDRLAGRGFYSSFDANDNRRVGYDELADGLYGAWDANDDNRLTRGEFTASRGWFGDEEGLFQDWDDDRSGGLSEDEFTGGLREAGIFESWDRDRNGWLAEDELYDAAYAGWDVDDDGLVGSDEWDETAGLFADAGLL